MPVPTAWAAPIRQAGMGYYRASAPVHGTARSFGVRTHAAIVIALGFMAATPAWVGARAETVEHAQVRIVTGAADFAAGSRLELRIYELGGTVRRLPLAHGEGWPHDSIRVVDVTLDPPLDPRSVTRYAIFYRAATPLARPWEVASAEVDLPQAVGDGQRTQGPRRLLDATLSGVIERQGELATAERDAHDLACRTDADCDDHLACDGVERCAPGTAGADARGCVKGQPLACPVNQICVERRGCVGLAGTGTGTAVPAKPR